jgi:hypothetical protein
MQTRKKRNRMQQIRTLKERLLIAARSDRELAKTTPPGRQRDLLIRRARQSETTAALDEWINSPGLRPPE